MLVPVPPSSLARASSGSAPVHPGFSSFKTTASIRYPARWHRDVLIQLTLDTNIDAISPLASDDPNILLIQVLRAGAPMSVRVADGTGIDHLPTITRSMAHADPRFTTARTIWASRETVVTGGDRIRLLRAIGEEPTGLPLGDLDRLVRAPIDDPFDVVLALVARGDLAVDIASRLTPATRVRLT